MKIRQMNVFQLFTHLFFLCLSIVFIVPLWAIISISLSDASDIVHYGYQLIPKTLSFSAYAYIFREPLVILTAYKVTIIYSVIGTLISVFILSACAYALSRRDFTYRKIITFYLFFTMIFNGGLVPTYILMTNYLHLQNTYAALIIPLMGSVWFLLLMKTFFQQLPFALIESATIDGASEFRIYFQMILPLSKPVLATVCLLQLLQYWNAWFPALLYISDSSLYPLQYLLQVILRNIDEILRNMNAGVTVNVTEAVDLPSESIRMAMAIVAVGPMLFIFPFFQKYFAKGLTVGSVK